MQLDSPDKLSRICAKAQTPHLNRIHAVANFGRCTEAHGTNKLQLVLAAAWAVHACLWHVGGWLRYVLEDGGPSDLLTGTSEL